MTQCSFINTLPDYVLDRTIIINDSHEHRISGFKLAKASNYFKQQLVQLRQGEIENFQRGESENSDDKQRRTRRRRARSLCDLEFKPLKIHFPDLYGLETILSYIHCGDESGYTTISSRLNTENLGSLLKAGIDLQVPTFIHKCLEIIEHTLNIENCLDYWRTGEELAAELPDLNSLVMRYVLSNFMEISGAGELVNLSKDQLRKLLRDDSLNCSQEKSLFNLVEVWIRHDPEKRQVHIGDLLECLRLGRLTSEELELISSSPLLQHAPEACGRLIMLARSPLDDSIMNPSAPTTSPPHSGDDFEIDAYLRRPRYPHSAVFVVGGWEGNQDDPNFGPSKAIQVYNSRANSWGRVSSEGLALDEGHAYSGCVLYKTRIFVIGGYLSSGPTQTLKSLELTKLAWKFLSPMHEKRNYICACLLENIIYAIGGHNGRHRLSSVERYDIEQNHWAFVSPMRQVRSDAGADSLHGKVYVVGGFDGHHFYDSVEVYDPRIDQWTLVAPMQNIRSGVSVVVANDHLFAIGGNDGLQRLRTVERYDPETNQWQTMPSMIHQRSNFCIALLDNMIYVMGGWSDETNSTISLVERWQPGQTTQWESVCELFLPASANCCCSVSGIDLILPFISAS